MFIPNFFKTAQPIKLNILLDPKSFHQFKKKNDGKNGQVGAVGHKRGGKKAIISPFQYHFSLISSMPLAFL